MRALALRHQLNEQRDEAACPIAEVNHRAIPVGAVDIDPTDLGDWETSGVLDVTSLFGFSTLTHQVNVQAHSLRGDLMGGEDANAQLVQGGQIVLLRQVDG